MKHSRRTGDVMLRCYECALQDKVEEAVAICIMCGKGMCMEHAMRVDLPIWTGGYPAPVKILQKGLPRFICRECADVLMPGACE
jgi:hypothetical protein